MKSKSNLLLLIIPILLFGNLLSFSPIYTSQIPKQSKINSKPSIKSPNQIKKASFIPKKNKQRNLKLSLNSKKQNSPLLSISDVQLQKIMSRLRITDPTFYEQLKHEKPIQRRLYLQVNHKRLLFDVSQDRSLEEGTDNAEIRDGLLGGAGAIAAGAALGRMAQTRELKALQAKSMKVKSELYMSRIAKRKNMQELQFGIYQLQNSLAALGDHYFSKSYELENSIESHLGY